MYNTSNDNYSHNDSYVVIITIYYFKNCEIYCVLSIVEYIFHKCAHAHTHIYILSSEIKSYISALYIAV